MIILIEVSKVETIKAHLTNLLNDKLEQFDSLTRQNFENLVNIEDNDQSFEEQVDHEENKEIANEELCPRLEFFCQTCTQYTPLSKSKPITESVILSFNSKFKHLGYELLQNVNYAPQQVCQKCITSFRRKSTSLIRPAVWLEGNHEKDDCFCCLTKTKGFRMLTRSQIEYPLVKNLIPPVFSTDSLSKSYCKDRQTGNISSGSSVTEEENSLSDDSEYTDDEQDRNFNSDKDDSVENGLMALSELSVTDGNSSKDPDFVSSQRKSVTARPINQLDFDLLFASINILSTKTEGNVVTFLKKRGLCETQVTAKYFTSAADRFMSYFSPGELKNSEGQLLRYSYCNDVEALMGEMQISELNQNPAKWRLSVDGTTESLKIVLLHNGNKLAPIPLAYSREMKECYENFKHLFEIINYNHFKWQICADFKAINILVGMCGGNPSKPCFCCTFERNVKGAPEVLYSGELNPTFIRRKSYKQPEKQNPTTADVRANDNIKYDAIVDISEDPNRVILPVLHIKFGLFTVLHKVFPEEFHEVIKNILTTGKNKKSEKMANEGTFNGPEIRKIINSPKFKQLLSNRKFSKEKRAVEAFEKVCQFILTSSYHDNRESLVQELLQSYSSLGCSYTLKIHSLHCHLNLIPQDANATSDEAGEQFHQRLKRLEVNFKGKCQEKMLATWCVRAWRLNLNVNV